MIKPAKQMRRNYNSRNQGKNEKGKNQPDFMRAVTQVTILWKSVEEYIGTSEEEEEERCFSCKKANVCGSGSKEVEWVTCNLCEKWYHVICEGACDEDLVSENYTCKLCRLV